MCSRDERGSIGSAADWHFIRPVPIADIDPAANRWRFARTQPAWWSWELSCEWGHCLAVSTAPLSWAGRQWEAPSRSWELGCLMVMCWQGWWWQCGHSVAHVTISLHQWGSLKVMRWPGWGGWSCLCWDSLPDAVKDLESNGLGFLAPLSPSVSTSASVLAGERNIFKMEKKKRNPIKRNLLSSLL